MKRRPRLIAASLLMAALATALRAQTQPIPKTITMIHGTLPFWADASVVLTDTGEPNPAVWGDQPTRIREILENPADNPVYYNGKIIGYSGTGDPHTPGCRDVGPTYVDYPEPPPR